MLYVALRLSTERYATSERWVWGWPYILTTMLCRYATHMFEQSSLPPTAEEGGAQIVHTESDGGGPQGLAPLGLSRHDSKLTAMMDDQPDEDYWWDVMHMKFLRLHPFPPHCNWLMLKGTFGLP